MLSRMHAADLARVLDAVHPAERIRVFRLILSVDARAEALVEARDEVQRELLEKLDNEEVIEVLDHLFGDDAADLLDQIPEERQRQVLKAWKGADDAKVDELLAYAADTAGGIMSPDVFALTEKTTVAEAISTLQASHEDLEMAFYLYVVTDLGQLAGVCSLRQLVISNPDAQLRDICTVDVVSVDVHTDQEEVARLVARYNILAIPVVDESNMLVGMVTVDDVIDVIREEATEDMFRMAGATPEAFQDESLFTSAKSRMPWLLASFIGGIGSMLIISGFEEEIATIAALAAFIPITLGMGGNIGTQAATIVVRGLAIGRLEMRGFTKAIIREISLGAIGGFGYGLLLASVSTALYYGEAATQPWTVLQLSSAVSLSVAACMTIAASVGGAVPFLFTRLDIDPAVATGPIVTTSVDIFGILTYFLIAQAILGI
jgi:magnesium transporter